MKISRRRAEMPGTKKCYRKFIRPFLVFKVRLWYDIRWYTPKRARYRKTEVRSFETKQGQQQQKERHRTDLPDPVGHGADHAVPQLHQLLCQCQPGAGGLLHLPHVGGGGPGGRGPHGEQSVYHHPERGGRGEGPLLSAGGELHPGRVRAGGHPGPEPPGGGVRHHHPPGDRPGDLHPDG